MAHTPAIGELSQAIKDLPPEDVPEAMGSLLEPHGNTPRLLQQTVALHEIEPATELLDSVEAAIGKVEDPAIRQDIGMQTVDSIIGTFKDKDADTVRSLTERADRIVELMPDPSIKTQAFLNISEAIVGSAAGGFIDPDIVTAAHDYIKRAGEAASTIEVPATGPNDKSQLLVKTAHALTNLAANPRFYESEIGHELLASQMAREVPDFYKRAIEASNAMVHPAERLTVRSSIAVDMVASAAQLRRVNHWTSQDLITASSSITSGILDEYSIHFPSSVACKSLAEFGDNLARTLGQAHEDLDEERNQQVSRQVLDIFKATLRHAATLNDHSSVDSETIASAAVSAGEVARTVIKANLETGKRILETGFTLSELADEARKVDPGSEGSRHFSLDRIIRGDWGTLKESPRGAFALAALAHDLAAPYSNEYVIGDDLRYNARRWLESWGELGETDLPEDFVLEETETGFIAFALDVAQAEHLQHAAQITDKIRQLHTMSPYIVEPGLRGKLAQTLSVLGEQLKDRQVPRTAVARMAQAIVRNATLPPV